MFFHFLLSYSFLFLIFSSFLQLPFSYFFFFLTASFFLFFLLSYFFFFSIHLLSTVIRFLYHAHYSALYIFALLHDTHPQLSFCFACPGFLSDFFTSFVKHAFTT